MPKIMEIIEKETKGKSYHTYKYSYKTIECVGCEAEILGNKVTLKGQLYGFTSAMFRVRR